MSDPAKTVAFQGMEGAYSHLSCRQALPDFIPLPCESFQEAFAAVNDGRARRAMIPIENSVAGRVADIHHLMPDSGLFIIGEHFQPVNHCLMAPAGGRIEDIKEIHSHIHALAQIRNLVAELGVKPVVHADTAGACRMVSERNDPAIASVGSSLAAETYGLEVLRERVQDYQNNVTRFVIMSRERITPHPDDGPVMTTFVFSVRSVPAALYKALGGFATNNINITKLESYIDPATFQQAQFYADIEGHPDSQGVQFALEEMQFFCSRFQLLGTYPQSRHRQSGGIKIEPAES